MLLLLLLLWGLGGCKDRGAPRPQGRDEKNASKQVRPRTAVPPPHRGPDPAPLDYPVKVSSSGKVLTYRPADQVDTKEQQFSQRHEDKAQVLSLLPLKEGLTVADVGCGAGYFTPSLARLVAPTGKVYALDIKKQLIADLRAMIAKDPGLDPHKLIQTRVSALDDIGLPADSLDVAFLAHLDFYLHSPLPGSLSRFLQSCVKALRGGGKLLILQWMQVPSQFLDANGQSASYSKRNLLDNMRSLGLVKVAEHDIRSPAKKSDRTKLFIFRKGDHKPASK